MSDLLAILNQGATSLAAQQALATTASHNIQNANTPGYARQNAVVVATLPADYAGNAWLGRGSQLQTVVQVRDRFLEAQIPAQLGLSAQSSATASQLSSVSALDPGAAGGMGDALDRFYAALRAMAQNPADPGARQAVVSASRSLANAFQSTRGSLESARAGADAELAGAVGEVNGLARQVADLNAQVRTASVGGAPPNDLLDARQKAVDRLAELTGASPVANNNGDVSLFLPGGAALVSDLQASTLATQADPTNSGHLQLTLAGPNGAAQAFTGVGGHLGGVLAARDGALRSAVDGLDALAWDLGNAVNAVHQAGFGLDGTTGDRLFAMGATQAGAAASLGVDAAILADPRRLAAAGAATSPTSAAPGDATNLQRLVATERAALSNGLTATDGFAKLTSDFGSAAKSAAAVADQDQAVHDRLLTMRDSASGVSIDDELIALQKAQRGYQAISRVIQTSSDMLDTLMSLKT